VDRAYPFPPGRPAHFFVGIALGLSPWAVVWFSPVAAVGLLALGFAASLGSLMARGTRAYGCGVVVALLFDVLLLALLSIAGIGNPSNWF